jgi:hypothetical protein
MKKVQTCIGPKVQREQPTTGREWTGCQTIFFSGAILMYVFGGTEQNLTI